MAAHSDNSIKIHAASCKGALKRHIDDKGDLGKHMRFTCASCAYVGRAGLYTDELQAKDKATAERAEARAKPAKPESVNPFGSKSKK